MASNQILPFRTLICHHSIEHDADFEGNKRGISENIQAMKTTVKLALILTNMQNLYTQINIVSVRASSLEAVDKFDCLTNGRWVVVWCVEGYEIQLTMLN